MSPIAVATSRAFPTSVWIRMYAWTTTRLLLRRRTVARRRNYRTWQGVREACTGGRPQGRQTMTVAKTGEFGLIARVTARLRPGPTTLLGPGDDAAVVAAPDGRVAASTDVLVEGRHFRRDWSPARDIGHRAAA